MKKEFNQVIDLYMKSEDGQREITNLYKLMQYPEWKTFQTILLNLGNRLADTAVSKKFQELPADERLLELAAISKTAELIKCLLNPWARVEQHAKIKAHNRLMSVKPTGTAQQGA